MNDVLMNALFERIKAGMMVIEEAPIPFQEEIGKRLEPIEEIGGEE